MSVMPRAYPEEFRRDVVEIARRNETPIAQIAKDFGISDAVIRRWLAKADIEDGLKPVTAVMESAELREANKRIRLLEMENEVLRRAAVYLGRGINPK
jgi:transposase-like protein